MVNVYQVVCCCEYGIDGVNYFIGVERVFVGDLISGFSELEPLFFVYNFQLFYSVQNIDECFFLGSSPERIKMPGNIFSPIES